MNNFFSNIINRHTENKNTDSQNIVLPQRKSLFEIHHHSSSQNFTGTDTNGSDLNTFIPNPYRQNASFLQEEKTERPLHNMQDARGNNLKKQEQFRAKADFKTEKPSVKPASVVKIQKSKFQKEVTNFPQDVSAQNNQASNLITPISQINQIKKSKKIPAEPKQTSSSVVKPAFLNSTAGLLNRSAQKGTFLHNYSQNQSIINKSDTKTTPQASTIKIHIGRIEIKAVKQISKKREKPVNRPQQGTSLEQFLKTRQTKI